MGTGQRQEWLRRFVPLTNGVPAHDTFGRVFAMLDTGRFAACLLRWTQSWAEAAPGRVIALDGKTLRNSFDDATGKKALHLVSAWSTDNRLTLGQVACAEKSNEIEALPRLLELLDLNGAVVTIDAMGCQTAIAAQIVEQGADYVLALKGNQPTLHALAQDAFVAAAEDPEAVPGLRRMVQKERRRGRDEVREYWIMPAPAAVSALPGWEHVRSLGMVLRRRLAADGTDAEAELRYYLDSRAPQVRRFAHAVRSHWGIENPLHWQLDVTFSEDASRIRKGAGPETTGLLRRVAVSTLHRGKDTWDSQASFRLARKAAGWSTDVLEQILFGKPS